MEHYEKMTGMERISKVVSFFPLPHSTQCKNWRASDAASQECYS